MGEQTTKVTVDSVPFLLFAFFLLLILLEQSNQNWEHQQPPKKSSYQWVVNKPFLKEIAVLITLPLLELILELLREQQWFWNWQNPWSPTEICSWLVNLICGGIFLHSMYSFIESKLYFDEDFIKSIYLMYVCVTRRQVIASRVFQIAISHHWKVQSLPWIFFPIPLVPFVLAQAFMWLHREPHLTAETLKLI